MLFAGRPVFLYCKPMPADNVKTAQNSKQDKRAAALRENLRRRKDKAKEKAKEKTGTGKKD